MSANGRGAVGGGAGLVWRRQSVLWWIFIVNFILAALGTMGYASKVGAVLNHSLEAQRLVTGKDVAVIGSLAMLPSNPYNSGSGTILGVVVFFIFMLFVEGGLLTLYRDDRRLTKGEFFEASGRFFWRFLRLMLYSLAPFVPVFMIVSGVSKWSSSLTSDAGHPVAGFWVMLIGLVVVLFLLTAIRLWFDMAQVHAVAEDEHAMHRAWRRGFKLTFGNFGSLYWMYLRISLAAWIVFAVVFWVWVKLVAPPSVGVSFVLSQLVLLWWLGTRLWQRSSETLWYQRHAELAAAPAVPAPYVPAPVAMAPGTEAMPEPPAV